MWRWLGMAGLVMVLGGCSAYMLDYQATGAESSSLVAYLYPDEASRQAHVETLPTLRLPVNVGVAFVPSTRSDLSRQAQQQLLEDTKAAFLEYDYINRIEVIPSDYLAQGRGFETLEQVARLYDVELMALVSYDQVRRSSENKAAFLYWTIVGMYVIPGNQNSVQTFVDTAVFDVKTRKMLFRAPGVSKQEETSTAIEASASLYEQGDAGFQLAMADMTTNLESELVRFTERVKNEEVARVEHKSGYSLGGGTLGGVGLLLLSLLNLGRRRFR
ncbi:rhombotarget lipoprotein [Ferrimonas balearica]|uniref:rhombotarget lipoprotein n=1 Tax=Ferrimonas balearica TaxID=44012 RepID=UPI001C998270|nr:rhombotarget lipoprotein [Ferrimonas balearica]MBY5992907.1 rhombotarget lipoprotein [Ferrimonas balearica]